MKTLTNLGGVQVPDTPASDALTPLAFTDALTAVDALLAPGGLPVGTLDPGANGQWARTVGGAVVWETPAITNSMIAAAAAITRSKLALPLTSSAFLGADVGPLALTTWTDLVTAGPLQVPANAFVLLLARARVQNTAGSATSGTSVALWQYSAGALGPNSSNAIDLAQIGRLAASGSAGDTASVILAGVVQPTVAGGAISFKLSAYTTTGSGVSVTAQPTIGGVSYMATWLWAVVL